MPALDQIAPEVERLRLKVRARLRRRPRTSGRKEIHLLIGCAGPPSLAGPVARRRDQATEKVRECLLELIRNMKKPRQNLAQYQSTVCASAARTCGWRPGRGDDANRAHPPRRTARRIASPRRCSSTGRSTRTCSSSTRQLRPTCTTTMWPSCAISTKSSFRATPSSWASLLYVVAVAAGRGPAAPKLTHGHGAQGNLPFRRRRPRLRPSTICWAPPRSSRQISARAVAQ